MARTDCKIERNARIYRAYMHGVRKATIARMEGLTTSRIQQIIAFTKQSLDAGDPDFAILFSDTKN